MAGQELISVPLNSRADHRRGALRFSTLVFATGVLFALFHDRLTRAILAFVTNEQHETSLRARGELDRNLRRMEDELRRTNGALVQAHEFLESVLESSTEYGIITKDLEGRVVAWSAGAARIYGYDVSEVIGRSGDDLHSPEEIRSGLVFELHRRALAEGRAKGLFRHRRKDGSEFLARVLLTRRNDAGGNAVGYLVVTHDVTAEQPHVEQQEFLAEVGETLPMSLDYTATLDRIADLAIGFIADCCIIDVVEEDGNPKRMRVVHVDPAKAPLAEALARVSPVRTHPIRGVLETKQPLLFHEVTRDVLESIAENEEHLRLLEALSAKSAVLVPLIARDRTIAVLTCLSCRPDRRYEAEDLRTAQELGKRASLALDNARLYELAQKAVHARDQVLGVVAHDLRNPLATILMQASLLRRRGSEPERRSREAVDRIERAANRMNHLVRDILDITRVEAGRLVIERAPVPAGLVVSESVEAQRALATSASLELRLDLRDDIPEVWADRHRLHQVFENLIGNAVKFTEPGGSIVVGAASRERDVLFWVSDTGSGIAAKDLPFVFERHWQAQRARNRGAGLGLPIVKGIVEAHGGRVWVESTPGQGSTFFFTMPAYAAAGTQTA